MEMKQLFHLQRYWQWPELLQSFISKPTIAKLQHIKKKKEKEKKC